MSRISERFKELEAKGQKALIAYVMTGFPNQKATLSAVRGLIKGGVDIIELGFPFSDPLADGPVIQNAGGVSLKRGTNISKFFAMVKKIRRETDIPLVLMTYTNILYNRGYEKCIAEASKAGIDGIILPDMSMEDSAEYLQAANNNDMDTIFLVSPNTSNARVQRIAKISTGFLYLVAVYGTTGVKTGIKDYTLKAIKDIKEQTAATKTVLGVGFGVSTAKDVKKYVSAGADAVIVGSAYLNLIEETAPDMLESKIALFTKDLKKQTVIRMSSKCGGHIS